jgi:hypothetical protein
MAPQPTANPFATLTAPKKPIKPIQQQPEVKPISQPSQGQQMTPQQPFAPAGGVQNLISPSSKPFNIADTELFKQSQATAASQLRGETPGFDTGATETRESLKLAQAQREKTIREQLAQRGIGVDDGRFAQEGIIKPEQEQFREREQLERQLLSDKSAQQRATIAQGQQASAGLLGLLSGQQQAQEQLKQTGTLTREQLASQEKTALAQIQAESQRLGRQLTAQEEAQIRDITSKETIFREDIAAEEARLGRQLDAQEKLALIERESRERLGFAEIASRENIAQLGADTQESLALLNERINTDQWIRQSEFAGAEAALDRELQLARDNNNFEQAKVLEAMKADLQERMQVRDIASREDLATMQIDAQENLVRLQDTLQSGQWARQSDFEAAQAALDRELQIAEGANNREQVLKIEEMKADLQDRLQRRQIASAENLAGMDIEAQQELVKLQDRLNTDQFMREVDFNESRDQLARAHELALQSNQFDQAKTIEEMQQKLELTMQKKDQEFNRTQNSANRMWQTNERLSTQDFEKNIQLIDQRFQTAVQDKDIRLQERLQDTRIKNELKMQLQGFDHDEQMTRLDADLQTAFADGDVERQKALIGFQAGIEFNKMRQEQSHDIAMQNLSGKIQERLAAGDRQGARILEQMRFENQQQLNIENFQQQQTLQKLDQAFQQQGLDMAEFESTYDRLAAQEAQGLVDPGSAINFLKTKLPPDIAESIKIADPNRVFDALDEDFLQQQFQWAQTHPDAGEFDEDGNFLGLKDDSFEQFNNHLNGTLYQTTEGPQDQILTDFRNGTLGIEDITPENFELLMSDPNTKTFDTRFHMQGTGVNKTQMITSMPPEGGFFKHNGNLYKLESTTVDDVAFGSDFKEYHIQNMGTGNTGVLSSRELFDPDKEFERIG